MGIITNAKDKVWKVFSKNAKALNKSTTASEILDMLTALAAGVTPLGLMADVKQFPTNDQTNNLGSLAVACSMSVKKVMEANMKKLNIKAHESMIINSGMNFSKFTLLGHIMMLVPKENLTIVGTVANARYKSSIGMYDDILAYGAAGKLEGSDKAKRSEILAKWSGVLKGFDVMDHLDLLCLKFPATITKNPGFFTKVGGSVVRFFASIFNLLSKIFYLPMRVFYFIWFLAKWPLYFAIVMEVATIILSIAGKADWLEYLDFVATLTNTDTNMRKSGDFLATYAHAGKFTAQFALGLAPNLVGFLVYNTWEGPLSPADVLWNPIEKGGEIVDLFKKKKLFEATKSNFTGRFHDHLEGMEEKYNISVSGIVFDTAIPFLNSTFVSAKGFMVEYFEVPDYLETKLKFASTPEEVKEAMEAYGRPLDTGLSEEEIMAFQDRYIKISDKKQFEISGAEGDELIIKQAEDVYEKQVALELGIYAGAHEEETAIPVEEEEVESATEDETGIAAASTNEEDAMTETEIPEREEADEADWPTITSDEAHDEEMEATIAAAEERLAVMMMAREQEEVLEARLEL